MPRMLALYLCIGFVLFLFIIDRKKNEGGSPARWLIVAYLAMIGSRAVSLWFNMGIEIVSPEDYVEGSPFDRNVYTAFLILGFIALASRKLKWQEIIQNNGWIFLFFLYALISMAWSDYPFVSFKRWIKNIGMLIMILLILTEDDPVQSLRWVFRKTAFLLIPFSVVLIRYFPEFGRMYTNAGDQQISGVGMNKNQLGAICFIYGIYFVWDLLVVRKRNLEKVRLTTWIDLGMLLIISYLILKANSATSLVCLTVGAGLLIFMELPSVKSNVGRFGVYVVAFLIFFGGLEMLFGLGEAIIGALGRDMTFTGRVDIWDKVLPLAENSIVGSGFETFWMGDRMLRMWDTQVWGIHQAHNGYIEIYLNLGLIGLLLLSVVMLTSYKKILLKMMSDHHLGSLKMAFLITALLYNFSEGAFRLGQVLLVFLLSCVEVQDWRLKPAQIPMKRVRRVPERRLIGVARGRG